jgi:hypothetical protein
MIPAVGLSPNNIAIPEKGSTFSTANYYEVTFSGAPPLNGTGIDLFIMKPYKPEALLNAIQRLVDCSRRVCRKQLLRCGFPQCCLVAKPMLTYPELNVGLPMSCSNGFVEFLTKKNPRI